MYRMALLLACFVCANYGWQVESFEDLGANAQARSLATFLLANNPGLTSNRVNQGPRAMRHASPLVRTSKQTMLSPGDRTTAMSMASNCIEEGCPVDLVTDLLNHLKAVKDPSAEVAEAIKDLEEGMNKPDRNVLEAILQDMARSFSTLDDKEPLGYSMKPGSGGYADEFGWTPPKATIDLASDCLESGCPVDVVKELLTKLRAEKNPSAEVLKTIDDLQKVLGTIPPNKNELERVVGDTVRFFSSFKK